jgi:hypothetical protein
MCLPLRRGPGSKITEKVVWHVVKNYAERLGVSTLAPGLQLSVGARDLQGYRTNNHPPNVFWRNRLIRSCPVIRGS